MSTGSHIGYGTISLSLFTRESTVANTKPLSKILNKGSFFKIPAPLFYKPGGLTEPSVAR